MGLVEVSRVADEIGIDQVSVTDHIAMSENLKGYPYGEFPVGLDFEWYEPVVILSAIAAATSRILLTTGILIGPLRSSALLAKQLATLDCLSGGRLHIGLGVGWQEEEYLAAGLPFEGRFGYLIEQVEAMRALWKSAPAEFHGQRIKFTGIHALPFPVQRDRLPIFFGLPPTERNIERIARHADGWLPMEQNPDKLAPAIGRLRDAFVRQGRDPSSLVVRVLPTEIAVDGRPNLEATLRAARALVEIGVTELQIRPLAYCRQFAEFPHFCERVVTLRKNMLC